MKQVVKKPVFGCTYDCAYRNAWFTEYILYLLYIYKIKQHELSWPSISAFFFQGFLAFGLWHFQIFSILSEMIIRHLAAKMILILKLRCYNYLFIWSENYCNNKDFLNCLMYLGMLLCDKHISQGPF